MVLKIFNSTNTIWNIWNYEPLKKTKRLNIMYKELEKYKTGKKSSSIIAVLPDGQEIRIPSNEYEAKLGDLINDFIEHKTKPFWKRKISHNHQTEMYLRMLNEISIINYW